MDRVWKCQKCRYVTMDATDGRCPVDGAALARAEIAGLTIADELLEDRYRLICELGRGGASVVYLAQQVRIGREVAVKIVEAEVGNTAPLERLEREARTVALIGHEHIVSILDFGWTHDRAYLVMERLHGENLGERLMRIERLDLVKACDIFIQVAFALEAAHARGIIHRDVKPGNILLCRRGDRRDFVKVVDFGLAAWKAARETRSRTGGASDWRTVQGTPGFIAPEQAMGRPVDFRADIFAMGASFYAALVGESPFRHETVAGSIMRGLHEDPILPSRRVVGLPLADQVDQLIMSALGKDPETRPSSAATFRRTLVRIRQQLGAPTRRAAERVSDEPNRRQPLSAWVSTSHEGSVVELVGALDEHADLRAVTDRIVSNNVRLKLGRVDRLNSVGHTRFTRWLRSLERRGCSVQLEECSPTLVRQANIEGEFFQRLPVESFLVPFACTECRFERSVLVLERDARGDGLGVRDCDRCGGHMTVDDVEGTYLLFLGHAKRRRERRRHERAAIIAPADCVSADGGSRSLFVTNLSSGGAFILAMRALPDVGTEVRIGIRPKGTPALPMIRAKVMHVRRDVSVPEWNGFGVRFVEMSDAVRAALADVLGQLDVSPLSTLDEPRLAPERREYARVSVDLPGEIEFARTRVRTRFGNLSMTGASFEVPESLPIAKGAEFAMRLDESPELWIRARAVRVSERDGRRWCGVAFIELGQAGGDDRVEAILLGQITTNLTGSFAEDDTIIP